MVFIIVSLIILFTITIMFCFASITKSAAHETKIIDNWYKEQLHQARENPGHELPDLRKIDKKE